MTNAQLAQVAVALVVAATPWLVVRIACLAANRHLPAPGGTAPSLTGQVLLGRATAAAALVLGTLAGLLPAPSALMGVIEILCFAALAAIALRMLGELERATRPSRDVDSAMRTASLVPRRRHDYLAAYWRLLLFGITTAGLALFAWRVTLSSSIDRQLFTPVAFAACALVFLGLYERWIHELVTGPLVSHPEDAGLDRGRWIRMVFAVEWLLVAGFLGLAHVVLTLDGPAGSPWSALALAAGVVLGVIGCALALSSDLITRRYHSVH